MEKQKKKCCQCDFIVEEDINFCPYCGSSEFENVDKDITMRLRPEDSPWYQRDGSSVSEAFKAINLQEFYEQYVSSKTKVWILLFIVMNFASSALGILSLLGGNILSFIDSIFYFLIGIFILRKKSWISSLIGSIYSGVCTLLNVILYQNTSGLLYVIISIIVMRKLHVFQAKYKEYTISRRIPEEKI